MNQFTIARIQHENILAWIVANGIKTEQGVELDFKYHRYLIDIYRDDSPNLVEMKAAQLGLSTMEIFRTFVPSPLCKKLKSVIIIPSNPGLGLA